VEGSWEETLIFGDNEEVVQLTRGVRRARQGDQDKALVVRLIYEGQLALNAENPGLRPYVPPRLSLEAEPG
jgi:hypothetical protein